LKLPGLEPYLRQAFPDMPVIEDTYLLIGQPMAGELRKHRRNSLVAGLYGVDSACA
jgi:hypothetical protein